MSGARASNRQATSPHPPASNVGGQIPQPIKRHLQFASMKPPFVPPEDYHRFSSGDARRVAATADQEAEAIVVKSTVRFSVPLINYDFCCFTDHWSGLIVF